MKKRLLWVALLLPFVMLGQIKLKGVVMDSLNNPLELASVVAINKKTNGFESYTITNKDGAYTLELKKNSDYRVQVSYIGLKTQNDSISTTDIDLNRDYNLIPEFALDEVELVYKMPVAVKGDTLVYNADSYTNGSERKLEDIIDKLPGVEINENGQIEVEGKVVNKLMVNGKDFFDGDTKVATKNIPSNAVDKIQILKSYSEVGQLSSVRNNQDNVAINIKLKEGKENFWFGNVTAGSGSAPEETLYLAQPKLFYYSPKYSINFIGDLNNIGEIGLSRRDIRGFGGGFNSPSSTSGTSINLGDNSLNFLTNQNNALRIENKLATANFSYSPNKALDISGFLIINSSKILSKEVSLIQYTNPELGIPDEATDQEGNERSNQALAKLSLSYKPNYSNQIDYDILGRTSNDTQNQSILSSVIGSTVQKEEVKPFNISQSLKYYYTLDENNIFALESQHLIKDEDPVYNAILDNSSGVNPYMVTANAIGFNSGFSDYNIGQNRRIKSNQLDAKLDYYHIINSKSNINITLGTILSYQQFNSTIFQFLEDNSLLNPIPNFNEGKASNDVSYVFKDFYIGAHYRFRTGKFTFTPGFSVHAYGNNNTQFKETFTDNFIKFLPDFETRIQLKKGESLTFNYNMRNQFTDVT
ncbi:MAG: carboxypeptidase-like regulatory domain-containing protein, partial [Flavobacteriaceae bacterium]